MAFKAVKKLCSATMRSLCQKYPRDLASEAAGDLIQKIEEWLADPFLRQLYSYAKETGYNATAPPPEARAQEQVSKKELEALERIKEMEARLIPSYPGWKKIAKTEGKDVATKQFQILKSTALATLEDDDVIIVDDEGDAGAVVEAATGVGTSGEEGVRAVDGDDDDERVIAAPILSGSKGKGAAATKLTGKKRARAEDGAVEDMPPATKAKHVTIDEVMNEVYPSGDENEEQEIAREEREAARARQVEVNAMRITSKKMKLTKEAVRSKMPTVVPKSLKQRQLAIMRKMNSMVQVLPETQEP